VLDEVASNLGTVTGLEVATYATFASLVNTVVAAAVTSSFPETTVSGWLLVFAVGSTPCAVLFSPSYYLSRRD